MKIVVCDSISPKGIALLQQRPEFQVVVLPKRLPAAEAANFANNTKELKQDTNSISGDLTEAGAKDLLTFRRRGNGNGPTVTDPKGSVKFWIKDGKLVKYQFHVQGSVDFNGNNFDVDRTTTVEIKDINSTKIAVSEDAKKKLE